MNKTDLTMEKRHQDLAHAIDEKEWEDCWILLQGLSEEERRELSKTVNDRLKHWKKVDREWFNQPKAPRNQYPNAILCALATYSLSELKKGGGDLLPWGDQLRLVSVFKDRRPTWMKEWCEYALSKSMELWCSVWIFIEDSDIEIDAENFSLGLWMNSLGLLQDDQSVSYFSKIGVLHDTENGILAKRLFDEHPGLVDKIWGIFEFDYRPISDDPIQTYDEFWTSAISYLVEEGKIDREKVLDLLFDCLSRDLHELRAKWLCSLHDQLQLSQDEKAKHLDSYLNLLDSRRKVTVKLALSFVKEEVRQGRLSYDQLVSHLEAPIQSTTKAIAKQAITHLKNAAKKQPDLKPEIVKTITKGFYNQAVDIQETCVDLIVSICDTNDIAKNLIDEIADAARMLETSNAKKISKWLDSFTEFECDDIADQSLYQDFDEASYTGVLEEAKKFDDEHRSLAEFCGVPQLLDLIDKKEGLPEAVKFDQFDIPQLNDADALRPIENHESLIDNLLYVIEHPEDIDQVERSINAMARLPANENDDFSTLSKPLEKRTIQILKRNPERASYVVILLLVLAWLNDNQVKDYGNVKPSQNLRQLAGDSKFYSRAFTLLMSRFASIGACLARRKSTDLLSTPTHKGGWIDPRVLVKKVNSLDTKRDRDKFDECFSLLRLSYDYREEALAELIESKDEYCRALRYVLDPQYESKFGSMDLWVAASRARHPIREDQSLIKRTGKNQSGITTGGEFTISVKPSGRLDDGTKSTYNCLQMNVEPAPPKDSEYFTGALYENQTSWSHHFPEPLWLFSLWPAGMEVLQSRAVCLLSNNIDLSEITVARENRVYVEMLIEPDTPMTPMPLASLSIALNAKMPDETGPALEALIAAIQDGRLDQYKLTEGLSLYLNTDLFMPNRLGKILLEAGRVSPLHNLVIADTIQMLVPNIDNKPPRGFHCLLETLLQLLSESNEKLSSASIREALKKLSATGKTKKLVKQILDLKGELNTNFRQEARFIALEGRLERARHWHICQ